jgi:hypothetical protein
VAELSFNNNNPYDLKNLKCPVRCISIPSYPESGLPVKAPDTDTRLSAVFEIALCLERAIILLNFKVVGGIDRENTRQPIIIYF